MSGPQRTKPVVCRGIVGAVALALLAGCGEAPVAPEAAPFPDEKVLLALDPFDPIYKLDNDGRVTHLKLDGRHVPGSVLAEVGKLSELQQLSLYAASLTDDDVVHLEDLRNLRNLGLGATAITDRGLTHLEKLPELRNAWLPKANLSAEAVEKLKKAVPGLSVHFQ